MEKTNRIGYRRDIVEFQFGNWSIPVHGCAEKSIDDSTRTLYLMAPYRQADEPWKWMYKVNVYAFNQEVENILDDIAEGEDVVDIAHHDVFGKAVLKQQEDYTTVKAQLNCGKEMLLIQIVICDPQIIPDLLEQVKQINCRKQKNDTFQA